MTRSGRFRRSSRGRVAIARADGESSAGGSELDGVLDQVPEGLLKSDGVGVDVVPASVQVDRELKLGRFEVVAADVDDVVDELMGVDELAFRRGASRVGSARGRGGRR